MSDAPERIWAGRLRGGALCDARCSIMEAKSGCTCAEIADVLTAAIARAEAAEAAFAEDGKTRIALGDRFILVPPDGGDVKTHEAASRAIDALHKAEARITQLEAAFQHSVECLGNVLASYSIRERAAWIAGRDAAASIADGQELACAKWVLSGLGNPVASEQCARIAESIRDLTPPDNTGGNDDK